MPRPGVAALLLAASCAALASGPGTLRTYSAIEVLEIENKRNAAGKKLPDEWVPRLREQFRYAAGSLHLFHRIEEEADPAVKGPETDRVIQMKVRITDYSGAQTQPKISAVVAFLDKATGEKVLERSVDAQLHFDMSATTGALIKLTNKVRDVIKDNW